MTPTADMRENTAAQRLNDLFRRYGDDRPTETGEIIIREYLARPDTLDNVGRIMAYDKSAESTIDAMHQAIETLIAYRLTLAERYNYLSTAETRLIVRLKRERRQDHYGKPPKVYYVLTVCRRYEDGTETEDERKVYSGKERAAALAAYKSYVAAHPGITAEMEIEKGRFEK